MGWREGYHSPDVDLPTDFRDALRHFPAGVTLVTTRTASGRHGMTVSAFASVSPEPPLVMVVIDHHHSLHALLADGKAPFAVNFLGAGQEELSNRFAFVKDADRFAVGDWGEAATGAPVLADAVAWLDCSPFTQVRAGTHTIFVGEVRASQVCRPGWPPLIYWNRDYRALRDVPEEAAP
jgi:flavin reductase (DIM6/NTAB) family NADH-FMN oxidoreductase RutF